MLPFEIAILSLSALVALVFVVSGRLVSRLGAGVLSLVAVALVSWHARVEIRHWQMWPCLFSICLLLFVLLTTPRSARVVRSIGGFALLLIAVSATATTILPMFQIPAATGPYHVGTAIVHLVDNSRRENYLHDPNARRELNIQLWYPTDAIQGKHAPYRRVGETTFTSRYQSAIATDAFEDAPMAAPRGPNPIVLFNPAWNGLRTQDTFATMDLASHGFVVISIDHTYNAIRTAFPDGRIVLAQSGDLDDFNRESAERLFERGNGELQTQVADNSFVLDTLQHWNLDAASPYHGMLDLARVGVMGHSFGGSVAIQTAISDPRVRSAINMDGWVFGDFIHAGLNKPLLQMIDDEPFPTEQDFASSDRTVHGYACFNGIFLISLQTSFQNNGGELLRFIGAKHMDFSDRPLFSPVRKLTSSGAGNWQAMASVVRRRTLDFFQRTLLDRETSPSQRPVDLTGVAVFSQWRPGIGSPPKLFNGSLQSCGINDLEKKALLQKNQ